MRPVLSDKIESGRLRVGPMGTSSGYGANGVFDVHGPCGTALRIVASSGHDPDDDGGWEHVSVSTKRRVPNWQEMSWVKDMFWDDEECVMQLHPPKSQYVNNHPYCLHLWRSRFMVIPQPPAIYVGNQALGDLTEKFKRIERFRGGVSSTPRDTPASVSGKRNPTDTVSG